MAKKPKMKMLSKIKIPNREIPEIDKETLKKVKPIPTQKSQQLPNAPRGKAPTVKAQPAVTKANPYGNSKAHLANVARNRGFDAAANEAIAQRKADLAAKGQSPPRRVLSPQAAPKAPAAVSAPARVRPVPMAKPVGKITPRVESRVRVISQPKPAGTIATRGTSLPSPSLKGLRDRSPIPASRAPAVSAPRLPAVIKSAPKPVVGGLARIEGALERVGTPLGTANATGSALRGSRKLFGALTGGKARMAASIVGPALLPEKATPALSAAYHAATARELMKFGAKRALGLGLRGAPIAGTALAGFEVANAGIEGYRAVKAQQDAQGAAERSAVKYASPLVHQQFLRKRSADALKSGAMPDSTKTGVPKSKHTAATPSRTNMGRSEFGTAFAQARKAGTKDFAYKGKQYNTTLASEPVKVSKVTGQNKETATPSYDSQSFVKTLPQAERSANNIVRADVGESSAPAKKPFKIGFGRFLRAHGKGSQ